METIFLPAGVKALYHAVAFTIELDQVPTAIRTCIELVRTCHTDLCDLIDMRNEYLPLLETHPKILDRMNGVISKAYKNLRDVCHLVEKCRPVTGSTKTTFRQRLVWVLVDSSTFKQYEPVISRDHSTVLAEFNLLRHLAMNSGTSGVQSESARFNGESNPVAYRPTFDNIEILGDIMGGSTSE